MDSPSFEGFHARLDWLNTGNTPLEYIVSWWKTTQNKTEVMKNIAKLA